MRRPLLLLLCVVFGAAPAAQRTSSLAASIIEGTVIDGVTGASVGGAIVSVSTRSGERRQMFAGPDGRFTFRDVTADTYQVTAQKGSVTGAYGRRWTGGTPAPLVIAARERHDPITIPLLPLASVTGIVYDEHGAPVPGVSAYAVRVTPNLPQQGSWEWLHNSTDERGEYSITGLRPGRYVVFVRSAHSTIVPEFRYSGNYIYSFAQLSNPSGPEVLDLRGEPLPPPATRGETMTYLTTFAPSSTTAAAASVFSFGLGEHRDGVNIRLQTARSVRVSGSIVQPNDDFKDVVLELVPTEGRDVLDLPGPTTVCDGTRFSFMSVPPGSYQLRATRSGGRFDVGTADDAALSARMPVVVGEQDVDGLVVTMRPGVRLRGRIVSDAMPPAWTWVALSRFDRFWQPMPSGRSLGYDLGADQSGAVSSSRLTPGEFFFSTATDAPAGWSLKSATMFGRDAIETPFVVGTDDIEDLVITLTTRLTTIRGVVRDEQGISSQADVVVFPSAPQSWTSRLAMSRRSKLVAVGTDGSYVANVPSGDYFVAAVRGPELEGWPDPAVLQKLAATATKIKVSEGSESSVDVFVRRR